MCDVSARSPERFWAPHKHIYRLLLLSTVSSLVIYLCHYLSPSVSLCLTLSASRSYSGSLYHSASLWASPLWVFLRVSLCSVLSASLSLSLSCLFLSLTSHISSSMDFSVMKSMHLHCQSTQHKVRYKNTRNQKNINIFQYVSLSLTVPVSLYLPVSDGPSAEGGVASHPGGGAHGQEEACVLQCVPAEVQLPGESG